MAEDTIVAEKTSVKQFVEVLFKPWAWEKESKMKKISIIKLLAFGILGALLIFVANCVYVVVSARRATPKIIAEAVNSERMEVCFEELSKGQVEALLAVEDPNFYHHKGIDFKTPGAGRKTITQELVSRIYSTNFKSKLTRVEKNLIARFAFNPLSTKEAQLGLFVNNVYLGFWEGRPVYGFCDAARTYFKKEFQEINQEEYMSLVAMIIQPSKFHVIRNPEANADRVSRIKLLLKGYYKPTGVMDLYYGGKYFEDKNRGFIVKFLMGY